MYTLFSTGYGLYRGHREFLEIPVNFYGVLTRCLPGPSETVMRKITKRVVDSTRPAEKDIYVWDQDLPGFALRIKPSGSKSFFLQYRIGGRRSPSKRITVGRYGVLTVEEARAKVRKLLCRIVDGADPAAERIEERKALTVGDLLNIYLSEGPAEKSNKKPSSWAAYRSNIERHIRPLLGRKLIKTLSQA